VPTVTASTVVETPPDEVWRLLRDFAAIGDWHPYLPPVRVENGPADRIGATRVFPTPQGEHRETLLALDDLDRTTTFRFDDTAGLPVRDYVATIRVLDAGDGGRALVVWSARFDCDAADEATVVVQVRDGVLRPGLAALVQRFQTVTTGGRQ
jgi:Polyketide cyclase / dehydrase and lipid transport